MLFIPYSQVNLTSILSESEIKEILTEKFRIEIIGKSEEVNSKQRGYTLINKYKGQIKNESFEIVERMSGQNIWTLNINGKIYPYNDSTIINCEITLNYTTWIYLIFFALVSLSIGLGIFLFSRISGELHPAFWTTIYFIIFLYIATLMVYHFKKYRMIHFLNKYLKAKKKRLTFNIKLKIQLLTHGIC